jgi:hypothetical protein
MAKVQTRRSVSVRGETYKKMHQFCKKADVSKSGLVEYILAEFFKKDRERTIKEIKEKGNGNTNTLNHQELIDAQNTFTF